MKEVMECECCGAKMVEYAHTLSKGIVKAFIKAVKVSHENRFTISECGLTYSERENIRKLQYWNLIHKADTNKEKGGDWIITDTGMDFVTGAISLYSKVWTYRGVVQRYEGKPKHITEITGGWKYRSEYAIEAVPHI